MAFCHRNSERKRIPHDYRRQEEEVVGSLYRLGNRTISPKSLLEQEKRIRREIANSNERRRMQSINLGFQSLRELLPHRKGHDLSKAAILQSAADYVYQLEQEKTRLMEQNSRLSRIMLNSPSIINNDSDGSCSDSPLSKRKKRKTADCVDEGIGSSSPSRSENGCEDVKREVLELRHTLERERSLRLILEVQIRNLESRLVQLGSAAGGNMKSSISVMNLGHENGLDSPQSQVSNQDVESSNEMSPREVNPDISSIEIPEDLSGKNSATTTVILSSSTLHSTFSPFPTEMSVTPQQETYKVSSRSRQNLETIVEAIKHVEGLGVFQGDVPKPVKSELSPTSEEDNLLSKEQIQKTAHSLTKSEFSFEHQIIRNAPLTQPRLGVIVSNIS